MRFGFGASNFELVPGQSLPAAHREMLEQATLAEESGFDSVWVAEQHFSPERQCPSPFLIGTAIATRTERIKVGVYTTMTFAHPIRVAEDAAVLDVLSEGRLILCAGTGYRKEEFAAYGIAAEWADEPFVYRGKYFMVPAVSPGDTTGEEYPPLSVFPKPIQNPIPIWMAAFGNVGVRQAGRLGLPLFTSPLESIPQLRERDVLYRAAMQESGQSQTLFPLLRSVYVAETAERARADTEAALLAQYRRYSRWRPQVAMEGTFEALTADRLIIGDPDQCVVQMRRYAAELGINYIACRMNLAGLAHTKVLNSIRLFAREVMPCFV
jgi:alkanesulfonate monooxygenase SsuD/methylene tetrahydromethanopterin reductase-like flavin-dependent oxidoreductase (luciferase family)